MVLAEASSWTSGGISKPLSLGATPSTTRSTPPGSRRSVSRRTSSAGSTTWCSAMQMTVTWKPKRSGWSRVPMAVARRSPRTAFICSPDSPCLLAAWLYSSTMPPELSLPRSTATKGAKAGGSCSSALESWTLIDRCSERVGRSTTTTYPRGYPATASVVEHLDAGGGLWDIQPLDILTQEASDFAHEILDPRQGVGRLRYRTAARWPLVEATPRKLLAAEI